MSKKLSKITLGICFCLCAMYSMMGSQAFADPKNPFAYITCSKNCQNDHLTVGEMGCYKETSGQAVASCIHNHVKEFGECAEKCWAS